MTEEEKCQIRNNTGKLLCKLSHDGYRWNVEIKRGSETTSLFLYPDGDYITSSTGTANNNDHTYDT